MPYQVSDGILTARDQEIEYRLYPFILDVVVSQDLAHLRDDTKNLTYEIVPEAAVLGNSLPTRWTEISAQFDSSKMRFMPSVGAVVDHLSAAIGTLRR